MFLEILKAIIYGIVEGITEWLPISSTGHLILLEQWLPLDASDAFMEMFDVDTAGSDFGGYRAVLSQAEPIFCTEKRYSKEKNLEPVV